MTPHDPAESERPRTWSGAGHTRAWASFVACGAAVAILLLLAIMEWRTSRTATRSDIGHGSLDGIGIFLYMVLVLGIAGVGLLLAISARREARGDPFVELALGTSMLTILGLLVIGPVLLQLAG